VRRCLHTRPQKPASRNAKSHGYSIALSG
jgi:hypothetical protein